MTQRVEFGPLSLEVPEKWTLSSVILAGPVEQAVQQGMLTTKGVPAFQRTLITTMEAVPADETPESFVKKQIDALTAAQVPRSETAQREVVSLPGGLQGLLTEQVITGDRGERVRQMQLVYIKDGIAFAAIASHLDGAAFESARSEFRAMLLSYR